LRVLAGLVCGVIRVCLCGFDCVRIGIRIVCERFKVIARIIGLRRACCRAISELLGAFAQGARLVLRLGEGAFEAFQRLRVEAGLLEHHLDRWRRCLCGGPAGEIRCGEECERHGRAREKKGEAFHPDMSLFGVMSCMLHAR